MIGGEYRDILLLQPGNHGWIESRILAARAPAPKVRPRLIASCPYTSADEHGISRLDLQSRFFQPCFEILDVDRSTRFEKLDAFHTRDIDKDAAREDSILQ